MRQYTFAVEINGYGNTPEEAWDDACIEFSLEPGACPDPEFVTVENTEEEVVEP